MVEHRVAIQDHMFAELVPIAEHEGKEVEDLVSEALQRYLLRKNRNVSF